MRFKPTRWVELYKVDSCMLSRWKSLRKLIHDNQDLTLFDEAVRCLEVKAFRMAYIASWIAIAESLKNKIKIMAETDKFADKTLNEIQDKEEKYIAPDKFILEKSKEIGMLDEISYQQIESILKMRNLYAHPYYEAPKKDEAAFAIEIAVEKVLSIPPLLRKQYINELLDNLQKNRHYIDDLEEKVVEFAIEVTPRIYQELYPYLLKCLFFRLDKCLNDPDKRLFSHRIIWFSRTFLSIIKPSLSDPKWDLGKKINDFPHAVSLILSFIDVWDFVPDDVRDSIFSVLLFPERDGKVIEPEPGALRRIFLLYENNKLSTRQRIRFTDRLDSLQLHYFVHVDIPLSFYADKIIASLASCNWHIQNPASQLLWNLGPRSMIDVQDEILELLGRNILQSAVGSAGQSIKFLIKSLESNIKWPNPFIKGLIYECLINEKMEFRCKSEHSREAILITIRCNIDDSISLIESLLEDLTKSKPKYELNRSYKVNEFIQAISEVLDELSANEKEMFKVPLIRLKEQLLDIAS